MEQDRQAVEGGVCCKSRLGQSLNIHTSHRKLIAMQVSDLFQNCAVQIQNLTILRRDIVNAIKRDPNMSSFTPAVKILTKHSLTFGKFFRRMQQLSHQRFALLPMCGDLILFYWSQVVEASSSPENTIAGTHIPFDSSRLLMCYRFGRGTVPPPFLGSRDGALQRKSCAMVGSTERRYSQ